MGMDEGCLSISKVSTRVAERDLDRSEPGMMEEEEEEEGRQDSLVRGLFQWQGGVEEHAESQQRRVEFSGGTGHVLIIIVAIWEFRHNPLTGGEPKLHWRFQWIDLLNLKWCQSIQRNKNSAVACSESWKMQQSPLYANKEHDRTLWQSQEFLLPPKHLHRLPKYLPCISFSSHEAIKTTGI